MNRGLYSSGVLWTSKAGGSNQSGNPAAVILLNFNLRILGQWLCVPSFRMVCLYPILIISAVFQKNLS